MADPICRWRNSSPKTVCELVSQLPKTQLTSEEFRGMMKKSIYGNSFFVTAYQLACQLGLYLEDEGIYTPRFRRDISEQEANIYLKKWFKNYYVPNPYTKKGFLNMKSPVIVLDAFIDYLSMNNRQADFRDICLEVFGETINNVDILVNCFRNYSDVITIDKELKATLSPNYESILKMQALNRIDKSAFFQHFTKEQLIDEKVMSDDRPLQLIYYGAPGTGKSFSIDKVTNDDNSVRTTFHPDSDYAGFVGAYKPTMENVPITVSGIAPKDGVYAEYAPKTDTHPGTERKIVYKYVPQAFLKAYVEAWKRYVDGEPFYLVIEEINRGNCAQIFGDLFQLLDRNNMGSSSYAINADEDIRQFLAEDEKGFKNLKNTSAGEAIENFILKKDSGAVEEIGESILNGTKLLLPPNLRIWATMNTSDQSLFPIDSAFKRRWNWEYVPIEYDKKNWTFSISGKTYNWGEFLKTINPIILNLTQSEDKQLGYFFVKPDKKSKNNLEENDLISDRLFVNKVLFYLWTDVFKDYDLTAEPFVYETVEDKTRKPYRFTDFFPVDNNPLLSKFIDGLGLKVIEIDDRSDIEKAEANTDDGKSQQASLSVIWPDGEKMNIGTKADIYIQSLKKIGLSTAMAKIGDYNRLGVPLISKEMDKRILFSNSYHYEKVDDYNIIIGLDNYGSILRHLSKELSLNLEVIGK